MPIWKSPILITREPLRAPPNEYDTASGALLDFWGIVRGTEDGRAISGIDYEAHEEMAAHQLEKIIAEARERFPLHRVLLHHRIGFVAAGEPSLFLRVTSGHRGEAFAASQWIVEELKKRVPIWKQPRFVRPEEDAPATAAAHQR